MALSWFASILCCLLVSQAAPASTTQPADSTSLPAEVGAAAARARADRVSDQAAKLGREIEANDCRLEGQIKEPRGKLDRPSDSSGGGGVAMAAALIGAVVGGFVSAVGAYFSQRRAALRQQRFMEAKSLGDEVASHIATGMARIGLLCEIANALHESEVHHAAGNLAGAKTHLDRYQDLERESRLVLRAYITEEFRLTTHFEAVSLLFGKEEGPAVSAALKRVDSSIVAGPRYPEGLKPGSKKEWISDLHGHMLRCFTDTVSLPYVAAYATLTARTRRHWWSGKPKEAQAESKAPHVGAPGQEIAQPPPDTIA